MDIDSAASTPILRFDGNLSKVGYLRYELTGLAYHLLGSDPIARKSTESRENAPPGSDPRTVPGSDPVTALVIGPGGGRDLLTALVFGADRVEGVEVNPIIARDVMLGEFRDFSGSIYANPRVSVAIDDGRSYVRRSNERYDIIQASLVDTWAATAAGAYTLTENTLYTKEAFDDYLDHHALGFRRLASGLARRSRMRVARVVARRPPRRGAAGSGGDVSVEEEPIYA